MLNPKLIPEPGDRGNFRTGPVPAGPVGVASFTKLSYSEEMSFEKKEYDCLGLFSGGLDSILAALVLMEQGLRVKCLHFVSPFFGKPDKIEHWKRIYGLDISMVEVGSEFADLLTAGPRFGFGKALNPCIDCKILMLRRAVRMTPEYGAKFVFSGEVVGQRPMSQRRDALNIIRREAGVRDILLRPLCAKRLDPIPAEESGLVDRERLLNLSGRGRKGQLALARKFGLKEIPTPAGGCLLAEKESARRYWPLLKHHPEADHFDFVLANLGRQYWRGGRWLAVGRDKGDNQRIEELAREGDLLFKVRGFPGPLCLGRQFSGARWPEEAVRSAAAFAAHFSPKAVRSGGPVVVEAARSGCLEEIPVSFGDKKSLGWIEPSWEELKEEKAAGS